MRFSTAAIFSTLAALAAAYTQPDYSKPPTGNAITSPGLNEQVPEGAPYEIKWNPTLGKRVSLVLLRGPSSNVKPLETIVENIPNSGHYTWTPGTNLTPDVTHYGLLLVVEGTGAYQWSTQFGISKPAGSGSAETTTSATGTVTVIDDMTTTICPETETTPAPTSTPQSTVVVTDDITTTICPEEESSSAAAAATSAPAVPSSTTAYSISEVTTTICPEEQSSSAATATAAPTSVSTRMPVPVPISPTTMRSSPVASVTPSGTVSATPTSSPVYNGAGRSAISFGAVAAGVFAVLAF